MRRDSIHKISRHLGVPTIEVLAMIYRGDHGYLDEGFVRLAVMYMHNGTLTKDIKDSASQFLKNICG